MSNQSREESFKHIAEKVSEITAGPLADPANWPTDRRWWLQLGFNLGRYSELSEEGRAVCDKWKNAVEKRDTDEIKRLSDEISGQLQ